MPAFRILEHLLLHQKMKLRSFHPFRYQILETHMNSKRVIKKTLAHAFCIIYFNPFST